MEPHPEQPTLPSTSATDTRRRLRSILLGRRGTDLELPAAADLTAAVTALARGNRRKSLVPLASCPAEIALVREGDDVLVSYYTTDDAPHVEARDRRVDLASLVHACARAALDEAQRQATTEGRVTERLARRALEATAEPDPAPPGGTLERRGGPTEPDDDLPVAFGFTAHLRPGTATPSEESHQADVHALLFEGTLWAFVRGRRITLVQGPIMLAVQRMVTAVRALVDAWQAGRGVHLRLRSGDFYIGVRLDRQGAASLTLGTGAAGQADEVTGSSLDVAEIALPVLRLASDLTRALVGADRAQSRNLRVRTLRDEVRALRKAVRRADREPSFVNRDPDRLRISAPPEHEATRDEPQRPAYGPSSLPAARSSSAPSLRFSERWRVDVDGLDASSTFLCGDRLVVATPRHTVALSREEGEVLWAREGDDATALMAGRTLLRALPQGQVELCDVDDGEPYAVARIEPRVGAPVQGLMAGGGPLPPVAVLTEGARRLVALDLRTGQPRWRFTSRGGDAFRLRRAGRVLLVASGDGCVHALDVTNGEVVWRFADRAQFTFAPDVAHEVVVAVSGDAGSRHGTAYGLDLFSGQLLWRHELDAAPSTAPITADGRIAFGLGRGDDASLTALEPADGGMAWRVPDPGLTGASLTVDRTLVINAPGGQLTGIDTADGSMRWSQQLSHPLADDVPRRLEPVLRGGALFVPAAKVHVVRPSDGARLGDPLACELVPDLLRVDERGWIYVAEESGSIAAHAPVPRLRVIDGGRS